MEYEARIEINHLAREDLLDAAHDELVGHATLVDPIIVADTKAGTTVLSYDCDAPHAYGALQLGLDALCRELGIGKRAVEVVSVEARPLQAAELNELVSQAEIARRLNVSREWVRKLAARTGFPKPVQLHGGRAGLYRWGDVLAWHDARHTRRAA